MGISTHKRKGKSSTTTFESCPFCGETMSDREYNGHIRNRCNVVEERYR